MAFPFSLGGSNGNLGGSLVLPYGAGYAPNPGNLGEHSTIGDVIPSHMSQNDEDGMYSQGQNANYTITHSIAITLPSDWNKARLETSMGQLTFINRDPKKSSLDFLPIVQPRSWSMLNLELRTKPMRRRFGSQRDCKDFFDAWNAYGFPVSDIRKFDTEPDSRLAMVVAGKIDVPNVWLANGEQQHPGDQLFMVARRYPWKDETGRLLEEAAGRTATVTSVSIMDDSDSDDDDGARAFFVPTFTDMDEDVTDDEDGGPKEMDDPDTDRTGRKRQEFYWQLEPYSCSSIEGPPLSYYYNAHFRGACKHIATSNFKYGAVLDMTQAMITAQQAIYPTTHDDAYIKALERLPRLEIHFRI